MGKQNRGTEEPFGTMARQLRVKEHTLLHIGSKHTSLLHLVRK